MHYRQLWAKASEQSLAWVAIRSNQFFLPKLRKMKSNVGKFRDLSWLAKLQDLDQKLFWAICPWKSSSTRIDQSWTILFPVSALIYKFSRFTICPYLQVLTFHFAEVFDEHWASSKKCVRINVSTGKYDSLMMILWIYVHCKKGFDEVSLSRIWWILSGLEIPLEKSENKGTAYKASTHVGKF